MPNYEEDVEKLKPRLTDEFLETIVLAARINGWTNDLHEIQSFIQNLYYWAGKASPEYIEPIDYVNETTNE